MVNKGRNHKEKGNFWGVLQIQSNQMKNWAEKLEILLYRKENSKKNP